jgi:hypothetical protein
MDEDLRLEVGESLTLRVSVADGFSRLSKVRPRRTLHSAGS